MHHTARTGRRYGHAPPATARALSRKEEPGVTGDPDDLLTIDEVITTLRVSRAAFYRWRRRGTGPATVRLPGGAVRIRRDALDGWLRGLHEDNKEEGTAA